MYPSSIEVARAALICFFFHPSREPSPVHTLKLRGFFGNYYPTNQLDEAMTALSYMKEVVRLPNGYWAPTPIRKVDLGKFSLILAPHTTEELARIISTKIRVAGYARTCENEEALTLLPSESLNDWLGCPKCLKEWSINLLQIANDNLTPSTSVGRAIQFYDPQKNYSTHLRWKTLTGLNSFSNSADLKLLRERTSFGQTRYFFGEIKNGKIHREAPDFNFDYVRLQYGLDLMAGVEGTYSLFTDDQTIVLRFFRRLPEAELRLIMALSHQKESKKADRNYELSINHYLPVEACLKNLGLRGQRII